MFGLILAGGFAKRMWPLTLNKPKHLLPIAGKPMIEYVLNQVAKIPAIEHIYISTNARFAPLFQQFLESLRSKIEVKVELVIEPTKSEAEKLGAIRAIEFLLQKYKLDAADDEMLLIGGDNLFEEDLINFYNFYKLKNNNVLGIYDVRDPEEAKLYGLVKLNHENKIVEFIEKPAEPSTTLIATACYIFKPETVRKIPTYLATGGKPDALGYFIEWLCRHDVIYGYVFRRAWFDIGSIEVYRRADAYFSSKLGQSLQAS